MKSENMYPKYYVIKKDIIEKIENDEFVSNQQIPSERELIQLYGFSRITVRKAIDELVNEGYLYKVHGKGTFVKSNVIQQNIITLHSITDDILEMGKVPSRTVLSFNVKNANKKRSRELNIEVNEDVVILDRIYMADQEPINKTTDYLPLKYFPDIISYDFSKHSLFDVLENHYGVIITKAERTIEAVIADDHIAKLLGLKKGYPILLFRGVTYGYIGGEEVPIESYKSYYRSDDRRFSITQVRVKK